MADTAGIFRALPEKLFNGLAAIESARNIVVVKITDGWSPALARADQVQREWIDDCPCKSKC
ncbi:hypothetical protein [Endobacterium cereale]|jgi:hypothetical protein|uniref:hypothetical protein n=1 Tax=Endobacterium cereale TaxID=2663029 RepID=UPI002B48BB05|nr:hypothetical protein [Endobacterium cereale]MEB2845825.1 hypothetical protein [Endobacterium cereale]